MNFVRFDGAICMVLVDLDVYGTVPLLKAAFQFTDRCYIHLQHRSEKQVEVRFRRKTIETEIENIAGAFMNELLDQALRAQISEETGPIKNLILAHALSKTSLIRPELEFAPPSTDPFKIASSDAKQ